MLVYGNLQCRLAQSGRSQRKMFNSRRVEMGAFGRLGALLPERDSMPGFASPHSGVAKGRFMPWVAIEAGVLHRGVTQRATPRRCSESGIPGKRPVGTPLHKCLNSRHYLLFKIRRQRFGDHFRATVAQCCMQHVPCIERRSPSHDNVAKDRRGPKRGDGGAG